MLWNACARNVIELMFPLVLRRLQKLLVSVSTMPGHLLMLISSVTGCGVCALPADSLNTIWPEARPGEVAGSGMKTVWPEACCWISGLPMPLNVFVTTLVGAGQPATAGTTVTVAVFGLASSAAGVVDTSTA